eukprot:3171381-Amphidinium_carterae.1
MGLRLVDPTVQLNCKIRLARVSSSAVARWQKPRPLSHTWRGCHSDTLFQLSPNSLHSHSVGGKDNGM